LERQEHVGGFAEDGALGLRHPGGDAGSGGEGRREDGGGGAAAMRDRLAGDQVDTLGQRMLANSAGQ